MLAAARLQGDHFYRGRLPLADTSQPAQENGMVKQRTVMTAIFSLRRPAFDMQRRSNLGKAQSSRLRVVS
jgi:hypothetical protein